MAIRDNTRGVLNEVDRRISEKLVTAALMVERTAKQTVPVLTGALKRSITHEPEVPKKEVMVGSNLTYAPFVELGTSRMSARPYLRPALEANMPAIKRLFGSI